MCTKFGFTDMDISYLNTNILLYYHIILHADVAADFHVLLSST
jgi:hypothetical protein